MMKVLRQIGHGSLRLCPNQIRLCQLSLDSSPSSDGERSCGTWEIL